MNLLRLLAAWAVTCSAVVAIPLSATTSAAVSAIRYRTSLSGGSADPATPSAATGRARVVVQSGRGRVSLILKVKGILISDLRQDLLRSKMGPIHLHQYIKRPDGSENVVLVLPVPYGDSYKGTKDGFVVELKSIDYAASAKLLQSTISFDDFLKAMNSGNVLLNIHTIRFPDGEISGRLRIATSPITSGKSGPDSHDPP